jgi:hypothetical protein
MPELCMRVITDPPPPLRSFREDVPAGLEEALGGALRKDPAQRYQNVAHFAAGLAPFGSPAAAASANKAARLLKVGTQSDPNARLSGLPPVAPVQGTRPAVTAPQAWGAGSQPPAPARAGTNPAVWIGLIVGLLVLGGLGAGAVVLLNGSKTPPPVAAANEALPEKPTTPATQATTAEPPPTPAVSAKPEDSAAPPVSASASSSAPAASTSAPAVSTAPATTKAPPVVAVPTRPVVVHPPVTTKPGDIDIPSTRR